MVKLTEDMIMMQSSFDDISVASSVMSCDSTPTSDNDSSTSLHDSLQSSNFKKVNCWGSEIDDISILSQLSTLEVLVLSSNAVHDLSPLKDCTKLSQLFLRRNKVSTFDQLVYLKGLTNLRTLWLLDNPVSKHEKYRLNVISILPQLTKLDSKAISDEERK